MAKISIIEVKSALQLLFNEVQSSEGSEAWELLRDYVEQQRQKQVEEGTLIIENPQR
jgi:hypothetical protein